jgi:predicted nucleotidyltransferase
MQPRIHINQRELAEICRRHGVKRLALFGSVLRDDFGPDSDVDMLVEFQPTARAGLLRMASMEQELSALVRRRVDLRTPAELSRYFRQQVLDQAHVQYVEG